MKSERTQTPILNIGTSIDIGSATMIVDSIKSKEGSPIITLNDNGHYFELTGKEIESYLFGIAGAM